MEKQTRFSIWYVFLAFWIVLILHEVIQASLIQDVSYSEFLTALEEGRVAEVAIDQQSIKGTMQVPPEDGEAVGSTRQFVTVRVEDPNLVEKLQAKEVQFRGVIQSQFMANLVAWLIPIALMVGIWYLLFSRMGQQRGILSVGKSKAKIYSEQDSGVTFADVAGVEESKAELVEVVQFLKEPSNFTAIGARLPKGVLLVGPPGTGKTLLARAVAGEAGVPFFSTSGAEFVEMFVGMGAARVRDLFEQAKKQAPCIIFIDELDALGKARGGGAVGGHDEREQTLNQLLVEMDGFDANVGIILMGATNRPEILDQALLRPGRFDRQVLVDRPDRAGRKAILEVHVKNVKMAEDVNLEAVAAMTAGFAGADLANLVNEAALLAVRRGEKAVSGPDFQEAIERIVAGLEKKNRLINERERRIVAYHEIGHALVGLSLPGAETVQKITIVPRGVAALGYTLNVPTEERFLLTRSELESRIAMTLGGRAAEEIACDDISTGAHNDLQKATAVARSMVTEYGMDATLGQVRLAPERANRFLPGMEMEGPRGISEETAREIDEAVRRILDEQYERAKRILAERREVLEEGARMLLEKEIIQGAELAALLREKGFEAVGVGPSETPTPVAAREDSPSWPQGGD
ncbi:MAG: ATP-dependent zinc metalloprotease FtsH [Acidobacteriota bacterium]|jgi:cell division protease FtsH